MLQDRYYSGHGSRHSIEFSIHVKSRSDLRSSAYLHKSILITKSKSRAEGKKAAVNCVVEMFSIDSLQAGKVVRNYWEEGEHDFRVSLGGNFEDREC